MRIVILAAVLAAVSLQAHPLRAASEGFTPAPVPSLGDGHVQPSARTGSDMTPNAADTPFSGVPLGSVANDGATSSNTVNGAQTPDLTGH